MNTSGVGKFDSSGNSGPNMPNDSNGNANMNDNQNQQFQPNSNYNGMNDQFGNSNNNQRGNQSMPQNTYQNQRMYFQDKNFNPSNRNPGNYNRFDQNSPNDGNYRGNYNPMDNYNGQNRNFPNGNYQDDFSRRNFQNGFDRGIPDSNYQNPGFGGNQNQYNDYNGRNRPNDYNGNMYNDDYMNGPNRNYQNFPNQRNDYDNYGPRGGNQNFGYNQRNMNSFDQRNPNFRNDDFGNQGNYNGNFGPNRGNQPWNDNGNQNQFDPRNSNPRYDNLGNQGSYNGNDYNQGFRNDMNSQNQFGQRNQNYQNGNFGSQGNYNGNGNGQWGSNDNGNSFGEQNQNYQNDNYGNQNYQNGNQGNQNYQNSNQGNQDYQNGNDYNDNSSSYKSNFGGGFSAGGRNKDTSLLCEDLQKRGENRIEGDFQKLNMAVGEVSDQEFEDFKLRENIKLIGDCPHRLFQFNQQMMLPQLYQNVRSQDWEEPTTIQKIAIPIVLSGKNIVGIAQTGSGKTAAYLIPAITYVINQNKKRGPHVLIMANTRELVKQIQEFGNILTTNTDVKVAVVFGGQGNRNQQIRDIRGADIIAASPGRLMDFINSDHIHTDSIGIVVIDEADKMVSPDFEPQCSAVLKNCPKNIQILMFSATWPDEVQFMAQQILGDYVRIIVNSRELTTNINIKQIIIRKERDCFGQLRQIIHQILNSKGDFPFPKVIIFCEKKRTVEEVHDRIAFQIKTVFTHGDIRQVDRDRAIERFIGAKEPIAMVCTALLSRGIDITDVTHVVNFDMPKNIAEYAHKIGRTGRMDRPGVAITLFDVRKDDRLRYDLVEYMKQAEQDIPELLQ